jgi:hypothetical protein
MGSLEPCASSTMRMICASTVAEPTAVARKAKAPVRLIVPPTRGAGALGDGHGLAGDHGFVEKDEPFDHLAVDGDLLAGGRTSTKSPSGDFGQRPGPWPVHRGGPARSCLEARQALVRLGGPASWRGSSNRGGQEDQRHDDARRLVVDVDGAGREEPGGEGLPRLE